MRIHRMVPMVMGRTDVKVSASKYRGTAQKSHIQGGEGPEQKGTFFISP
jgi:hypothetical protein